MDFTRRSIILWWMVICVHFMSAMSLNPTPSTCANLKPLFSRNAASVKFLLNEAEWIDVYDHVGDYAKNFLGILDKYKLNYEPKAYRRRRGAVQYPYEQPYEEYTEYEYTGPSSTQQPYEQPYEENEPEEEYYPENPNSAPEYEAVLALSPIDKDNLLLIYNLNEFGYNYKYVIQHLAQILELIYDAITADIPSTGVFVPV